MENNKLTQGKNYLPSINVINDTRRHGEVIAQLGNTIEKAIPAVPVKNLINQGAEKRNIISLVAVLVLKYARLLTCSGNLQEGHALTIADALVEEYPYQSLTDFNIMLLRGTRSRYGVPYRFDISVCFDWMNKYIDEYYEECERMVKVGKVAEKVTNLPELSPEASERVDLLLNQFLFDLDKTEAKVKPITEEDIRREGKERVKRKGTNYLPNPELVVMQDMKLKYARLHTDLRTGKVKEGSPSFDEWLRSVPSH